MACHTTPPVAPQALTRPHTTPLERLDTKGTTPYTVPHVICGPAGCCQHQLSTELGMPDADRSGATVQVHTQQAMWHAC